MIEVGDRCVIVERVGHSVPDVHRHLLGEVVTITGFYSNVLLFATIEEDLFSEGDRLHGVSINLLRKIDDDYDGNEVATWDKCAWQPNKVVDESR